MRKLKGYEMQDEYSDKMRFLYTRTHQIIAIEKINWKKNKRWGLISEGVWKL